MPSRRRHPLFLLAALTLLACCTGPRSQVVQQPVASTPAFAVEIDLATPPPPATARVLVTHPTVRVLRRMVTLVEEGLLEVPGLQIVGLIHDAEREDYAGAEAYVRAQARPWLRLGRIDCPLTDATVFSANPCTPVFARLVQGAAGVVFTGGPDLPPALYGEETALTTVLEDPPRQRAELSLLYHMLGRGEAGAAAPLLQARPEFPVLAICMGMQAMNVAAGGTMIQDIPSELYGVTTYEGILRQPAAEVHRNAHYQLDPAPGVAWGVFHPVRLEGESPLRELVADADNPVMALSAHHQALESLGADLRVVARSLDGKVVEAVVHDRFPNVLGVQFHPDYLVLWRPDETFTLQPNHPVRNLAAAQMAQDPRARALHRGIWQWFAARVHASAPLRGGG